MERFNQTLQGMLVKFIDKKKESWEDYLKKCVLLSYAYNTSKHKSSKYTPFEMFRRRAVLTIDLNVAKHCCEPLEESIADEVLEAKMEKNSTTASTLNRSVFNWSLCVEGLHSQKTCR